MTANWHPDPEPGETRWLWITEAAGGEWQPALCLGQFGVWRNAWEWLLTGGRVVGLIRHDCCDPNWARLEPPP